MQGDFRYFWRKLATIACRFCLHSFTKEKGLPFLLTINGRFSVKSPPPTFFERLAVILKNSHLFLIGCAYKVFLRNIGLCPTFSHLKKAAFRHLGDKPSLRYNIIVAGTLCAFYKSGRTASSAIFAYFAANVFSTSAAFALLAGRRRRRVIAATSFPFYKAGAQRLPLY